VEPVYDRDACKGGPIKYYYKSDEVKFVVLPVTPGNDAPVDLGTVQLHPEGEAPPPEPENAPPGLLVDKLEGGTLSLQDLRGRYVLIDFWAVWCKPCEAQLPHLKNIWQEFGQRSDFVLLGLCLGEDKKIISDFVTGHQESWPQGVLLEGFSDPVAEQYGVTALPNILLIGPDGNIIADNLLDDQIEAAVRAALGKANP
jgi:peroxiredoxin